MEYLFLILIVISVFLLAAAVVFFVAAYFTCRIRREEERKEGDLEKGIPCAMVGDAKDEFGDGVGGDVRKYSWDEIERLTMDFTAPVIGQGGYSTVYWGRLPNSTTPVAVKVHRESERLHQAFKQELEVLLRVRHENIVRLIGYCDEKEEGALVFEYIPNGTLHEKLHFGTTTTPTLTWSQRMSIAYTLATSLEYLHDRFDPQIIHSDLKPLNILLTSTHHTKLCDFGSAKIGFSASISPTPTTRNLRYTIVGSPGYSDPHYLKTGMTSKKSDVYSFGVLVMELVTGVEAFDEEKGGTVWTAEMLGSVDGRLDGDYDEKEREVIAEVVGRCVREQPSLRPSMAEVVGIFKESIARSIAAVDEKLWL